MTIASETLCPKHSPATGVKPWRTERPDCRACDKAEAICELRTLCAPGTTVYTILRSVSRSGMSRWLSVFLIRDGAPYAITGDVARVLGERLGDAVGYRALKVSGAGMDMGYHLVNSLSYALHGAEQVEVNLNTPLPKAVQYRPGYTLNHRWL